MPPNLAHFVCQIDSSPLRPHRSFPKGKSLFDAFTRQIFPPVALLWIKKLDREKFKLQQTAMKFSTNIISATVYLFVRSSCLRGVENAAASTLRCQHCGVNGSSWAPPPTGLDNFFCNFRLHTDQITYFYESFCPAFFKKREVFAKPFSKGWGNYTLYCVEAVV